MYTKIRPGSLMIHRWPPLNKVNVHDRYCARGIGAMDHVYNPALNRVSITEEQSRRTNALFSSASLVGTTLPTQSRMEGALPQSSARFSTVVCASGPDCARSSYWVPERALRTNGVCQSYRLLCPHISAYLLFRPQ